MENGVRVQLADKYIVAIVSNRLVKQLHTDPVPRKESPVIQAARKVRLEMMERPARLEK